MPAALVKAHQALDRAVDKCYGKKSFGSESERMSHLFALYVQYTAPLEAAASKPKKRGRKEAAEA